MDWRDARGEIEQISWVIQVRNGYLDIGWVSDVGREGGKVDVFSMYKRQIYNRTWKRKYQRWHLNIWFMILWWDIAMHLGQKHKLIGPDI